MARSASSVGNAIVILVRNALEQQRLASTAAGQSGKDLSATLVPALEFLCCTGEVARVYFPQQRRLLEIAGTKVESERNEGVELI